MASGPGNRDNENESTSVIVSVQQSGWPLVPTDNPLSVGLVSNSTATTTRGSSRCFMDLNILKERFLMNCRPGFRMFAYSLSNVYVERARTSLRSPPVTARDCRSYEQFVVVSLSVSVCVDSSGATIVFFSSLAVVFDR